MTTRVHLVGSVALDTSEEVFAAAGRLLGPYLRRVPDGEPGGRRLWISWQIPLLRAAPTLTPAVAPGPGERASWLPLRLANGVSAADVHFGELGYSREARASYMDFLAARGQRRAARRSPFPGVSADSHRCHQHVLHA
jgi:hypothetical protein